jgi:hypothetical protein
VAAVATLAVAEPAAAQAERNSRSSVTAAFGAGMNTAQPGNPQNPHVLPRVIEIKAGGVVNFAVAGFHQICNVRTHFLDGMYAYVRVSQ